MSDFEPTMGRPGAPAVEQAARKFFAKGPRSHGSAFEPGRSVWNSATVDELMTYFVGQPDISGATFDAKLALQLAPVSDDAKLLFAELFYLNLLPLDDYHAKTKRTLVTGVLRMMANPVALPQDYAEALDPGVFGGGMAFKRHRYFQLCYLIEFAAAAVNSSNQVWDDPWAFRQLLDSASNRNLPSQRNSLLYLAFPDTFLPITSEDHRQEIRREFASVLSEPTGDIDKDLRQIYRTLSAEQQAPVNFYVDPWRQRWNQGKELTPGQHAWLVRGSAVDGHDMTPTWLAEGFVSLRANQLRPITSDITREELRQIIAEDYSQASYNSKITKLDEFYPFLAHMKVDDVVVTTSQGQLYVGTIAGDAEYVESPHARSNLRRPVIWEPQGTDYSLLDSEIKGRLSIQYDVVEMTQQLDLLLPLVASETGDNETLPVRDLQLPDATAELASSLHVDQSWLQECIDLLRDRPQLIFYGPPGTGKTYIAQKLAAHLAGDNVRLTQFHPAYTYEDFFEGFRPTADGTFQLKPGPLRKTVDAARDNPSTPYVLIIDEINRGNLAKIFGELYFLLEYREQNIELLYATDDNTGFTLPKNVFIIGTMNTADRSIALVDAAMRRRFAFLALHPSQPPTKDVLRRWLDAEGYEAGVADLLDELNRLIDDEDFKIGPSYFMRSAVHAEQGLERTWRTAILPLLEEHHFGDGIDVGERYALESIRQRVARRAAAQPQADDPVNDDSPDPA